ncbi:MAG: hypothetical protein K0Q43_671 [Ramlibacter sp.]|jgi:hypothetical protein|nr:hypothetical protein [Ramlibacter sp.]
MKYLTDVCAFLTVGLATLLIQTASAQTAPASAKQIAPERFEGTLVGNWTGYSYNNGYDGQTGNITFYPNGTFQITGGVLSVLIASCLNQDCTGQMGTWEIIHGSILKMRVNAVSDYAYPLVVQAQRNQIELIRSSNLTVLTRP